MPQTKEFLTEVLTRRLGTSGLRAQDCFNHASEVIVFGSMSAGLHRSDSDMDVLCIGESDFKLKTDSLDLIVIPRRVTRSRAWLEGELASHVAEYGTWIKGSSEWKCSVRVGPQAVEAKRRRVAAFMRYLPDSWSRLEECFRVKYSIKLRREAQRLILLERGVSVPPTRILDCSWADISKSPDDVSDRLRRFASDTHVSFVDDLTERISTHLEQSFLATQIP